MGARIRSFDWSSTPLGRIDEWPLSLLDAVSICLRSRFQLAIYWGPQLVLLYNDAERDVLGAMHPGALGRPAAEILSDMWDVVGPMLHGVMATGKATWSVDQALRFNRRGFLEEAFFTYSYSPIPDGARVGGVLLVTFETTERVLAERRLRTLRELAAETAKAQSADEACSRGVGVLAGNRSDLPFALLFLTDGDGGFRQCASTGVASAADPALWPLREVSLTRQARRVEDVASRLPGERAALPRAALVLPIAQPDKESARGCLVAGLSDFLAPDEAYRGFLHLVAGQIATKDGELPVVYHDTTAWKRSEDALLKYHAELEQRVRDRTRELSRANARLQRQVAKRKQVEEARTELLRRLVHAQEKEHRRIARELHDDLTQRLAVLAIDAGALEHLPGCLPDVAGKARDMREQLAALSESVHSLSRQLHPSILDDLGLVDALRSECLSLGQRDGLEVKYHAGDIPTNLPRDVALSVYRVAQEALRNVVRHGRCSNASVRLVADDRELVLCVRDRGVGFDVARQGRTGLGVESMRERVRLIHGRLAIRSRQGEGTKITLHVPLQRSPS
jgi:signal transduction histidine kinase